MASALGGCGTALNMNGESQMYGGVLQDFQKCKEGLAQTPAQQKAPDPQQQGVDATTGAIALADMPLSLVADTVTLPLTIQATIEKKLEKMQQADAARNREARLKEVDRQLHLLIEEKKSLEKDKPPSPTSTPSPEAPPVVAPQGGKTP
jgi:uncharacterized protein YceK